jgi:hypothetical protein
VVKSNGNRRPVDCLVEANSAVKTFGGSWPWQKDEGCPATEENHCLLKEMFKKKQKKKKKKKKRANVIWLSQFWRPGNLPNL